MNKVLLIIKNNKFEHDWNNDINPSLISYTKIAQ